MCIRDSHLPLDRLPSASAIINPKKKNCNYPFKELAGVGVVYKLVCAILNRKFLLEYLDLVCLGTIADNVPLRGENRIIAKKV
jgi:Single-stranded DNA-specific exonuclease